MLLCPSIGDEQMSYKIYRTNYIDKYLSDICFMFNLHFVHTGLCHTSDSDHDTERECIVINAEDAT